MKKAFFGLVLVFACCLPFAASAQVQVEANTDHAAMLASPNAQQAANKRLVYDFWREVLEAGHLELVDQFLTESYIQHNPEVPTGRAGFVQFFSQVAKPAPIQAAVSASLVGIIAEGNFVVLSFVQELPEPKDPSKTYTTTWFDMFRIEGNKIAEHWDPTVKAPAEKVATIQLDESILKHYVGTYKITSITPAQAKFPDDAAIEITLVNHQLTLDMSGHGMHTSGASVLFATSLDNFVDDDGSTMIFKHDEQGVIKEAALSASGMVFTGRK